MARLMRLVQPFHHRTTYVTISCQNWICPPPPDWRCAPAEACSLERFMIKQHEPQCRGVELLKYLTAKSRRRRDVAGCPSIEMLAYGMPVACQVEFLEVVRDVGVNDTVGRESISQHKKSAVRLGVPDGDNWNAPIFRCSGFNCSTRRRDGHCLGHVRVAGGGWKNKKSAP